MRKLMFNDQCGLTQAVLEGRKTMTRREIIVPETWHGCKVCGTKSKGRVLMLLDSDGYVMRDDSGRLSGILPKYKEGEEVAVAQSYKDALGFEGSEYWQRHSAGWDNKMFVKAELMPRRIKITKAKVERLQDISAEDAIREGVQCVQVPGGWRFVAGGERVTKEDRERILSGELKLSDKCSFDNHQDAFAKLIDKVSGKGTWKRNPWVFVYSFELVK